MLAFERLLPLFNRLLPALVVPAMLGGQALIMMLGALSGRGFAQAPSILTALTENQDGKVQDIAAQADAGDTQSTRMWLAQGRVRAAFRLGDRARMFTEDTSFPTGAPTLS